ncbi:hypothetical protein BBJ28_00011981, partial [Nothophytophthora sp. Chile5]
RTAIKRQPWTKDPAARRQATLALQRQARRDLADHARQLAQSDEPLSRAVRAREDADEEAVGGAAPKRKTREDRVKQRREHFSKQLMVPEWLIDVPRDLNGSGSALGEGWYVLPRPEGKRCLVVANGGITIARIPSGNILKKFPSALPCGSHKTNKASDSYCILDCIFQEHDDTFYVLDVMCWKGYLLYNCTTEFRLYWLRDKLSEGAAATVTPANPFRFLLSEGDLANFSFEQHEVDEDQKPHLTALTFLKRCSPQRALPDSWTKILFQYNARSGGIPVERILEVRSSLYMRVLCVLVAAFP